MKVNDAVNAKKFKSLNVIALCLVFFAMFSFNVILSFIVVIHKFFWPEERDAFFWKFLQFGIFGLSFPVFLILLVFGLLIYGLKLRNNFKIMEKTVISNFSLKLKRWRVFQFFFELFFFD